MCVSVYEASAVTEITTELQRQGKFIFLTGKNVVKICVGAFPRTGKHFYFLWGK